MQSGFTKIPAFKHFNLVDICSPIVKYNLADLLTLIFFPKMRYLPLINLNYLAFFHAETDAVY